jgi:predicted metal-dependent TIM-barrel fold hydrolase
MCDKEDGEPTKAPLMTLPSGIFDVHLTPTGLAEDELKTLQAFGVTNALLALGVGFSSSSHTDVMTQLQSLVSREHQRVAKAGIEAWVAVGIHPMVVPRRGLHDVLQSLMEFLGKPRVVALGDVGLHHGGPLEEEAFSEQLALARRFKLPVLVHTPSRNKERLTRLSLQLIQKSGVAPSRVLFLHTTEKTVRLVLECGHFAGLTIHPDALTSDRALRIIQRIGVERLALSSSLSQAPGDLLGLPRLLSRLQMLGASDALMDKVAFGNARRFLRL